MKPCWGIVVLSSWIVGALCASAATLTTEDVVKMTRARLNDEVIVQTIEATGSRFNLTPKDVNRLKTQGVSERVLAVMQSSVRSPQSANEGQIVSDLSSPSYQFPTTNTVVRGIYVAPPTSGSYYCYPPSAYDYYYPPPRADCWFWCRPLLSFFFGPGFRGGPGHYHGPGGHPR